MKSHARAVVIGGGVVGVSTLYHLAKKGWSDVVLVERKELTSGSTWHAAGLLPLFNMSYSVGQIHKYSVALYKTLEAETGQNVGFSVCSNIRLARTKDRWDEFMYYAGVAETIGVNVNVLTPDEVKEIWPLCVTDGILGAIQHPDDGYIQPADLTQALARGARSRGAEINRNTKVVAIEQQPSGEWLVKTDKGDIVCEHVVSATGNFARRTGAMVGLDVPVIPVEHQYIVTEPHPAIQERRAKGLPEMGVLREADSSWYMREEAGGLLLGPYEKGAPACYVDGPSEEAEYELFQEDLERLMPHIETAIARVPAFGEVGIKKVYNGAIAYTPDGSPIVGPAWGLKNFWLNEGHSFGVTAAGGAGWQLAEWIVEGEPSIDMMGVDPRRFGPYASRGYLKAEERGSLRQRLHAALSRRGARCGAAAEDGALLRPHARRSARSSARSTAGSGRTGSRRRAIRFRRTSSTPTTCSSTTTTRRPTIPARCASAGRSAAPTISSMSATSAGTWRSMSACRTCRPSPNAYVDRPRRGGVARLDLRQPHPEEGRPRPPLPPADEARRRALGVHRLPDAAQGGFYLVSAGALERHDHDYAEQAAARPTAASACIPVTTAWGVLVLAGPRSRDVLAEAHRRRPLQRGVSRG